MASWRDGAEYAPTERPDGFATPTAAPLSAAEPWRAPTPGPLAAPEDFDAPESAPLSSVSVRAESTRDPRDPITTVAAALAPAGAPRVDRDPREPIVTSAPRIPGPDWNSDAGAQLPPPTGLPLHRMPPPAVPAPPQPAAAPGFPPPSMPQGAAGPQRVAAPASGAQRQLALVAGALSFLGFLVPSIAPFVLVGAGALGLRTTALTGRAGSWALGVGLATVAVRFVTGSLGEPSVLATLAALGFTFAFVVGGLRRR
ncbi:hypothetical protein TESS_TESS_02208 [Tessaracoccus sp. O5.2]|uniref:hypothetical protein n=1 Tax=Tessaracoccus sp. O5.2 TaxID=3157622 RepID=UPI0035E8F611